LLGASLQARTPRSPKTLKAQAIALLARREYSRAELRDKLRDKLTTGGDHGTDGADVVEALLDELAALGFLSDARFAQSVVRQKSGGYSKRAIGAALKARGVAGEAAADALAGVEIDDLDAMIALWRRRFGVPPANDKEKARQLRFLQSRGFSLSSIFKLLRHPPGGADAT
jgi:regulatory protein